MKRRLLYKKSSFVTVNGELPYIVGWSTILEVGPVKFNQLLAAFGSAKQAWEAKSSRFEVLGWGQDLTAKILAARGKIDPDKEFEKCQKLKVKLLTPTAETYPKLLKEIHDPPFLLYVLGELLPQDGLALAVVGSRRMSPYGSSVVEEIVPNLVSFGLTIVSGLAFGVDYKATETAFESGGRTVSVLASGVDLITPRHHEDLIHRILSSGLGAVVSEFPLGTTAQPFYFPRRNRIIAGLALGVFVVEAAEKSGALITAQSATEEGREVFAAPGSIFSLVSVGCHELISQGAKVVTKVHDILKELQVESVSQALKVREDLPLSVLEAELLAKLNDGQEIHVDEMVRFSNLPGGEIFSSLTLLELKGMVKNIGGGYYRKI